MRRMLVPALLLLMAVAAAAMQLSLGLIRLPFSLSSATTPPAAVAPAEPQRLAALPAGEVPRDPAVDGTPAATSKPASDFDVARVDPGGTSVFAGKTRPKAWVTVLADGKPVGSAQADGNGEWTVVTGEAMAASPRLSVATSDAPPAPVVARAAAVPSGLESQSASRDAQSAALGTQSAARDTQSTARDTQAASRDVEAVGKQVVGRLQAMVASARAAAGAPAAPPPDAPAAALATAKDASSGSGEPAMAQGALAAPSSQAAAAPAAGGARAAAADGRVALADMNNPPPASGPARNAAAPARADAGIGPPVPIMFQYREATFTDEGRKAAELLLEYVRLKGLHALRISGHADERGTAELNMELSRDRLETVARFLRDGGYHGALDMIPKGKSEPYMGVDRSRYPREVLYQLDRRVELGSGP